eukprot:Gb_37211 [translate_table: standard]
MLPLVRGSMKGYTFPERSKGNEPTPPRQPMKGNLYLDLLGHHPRSPRKGEKIIDVCAKSWHLGSPAHYRHKSHPPRASFQGEAQFFFRVMILVDRVKSSSHRTFTYATDKERGWTRCKNPLVAQHKRARARGRESNGKTGGQRSWENAGMGGRKREGEESSPARHPEIWAAISPSSALLMTYRSGLESHRGDRIFTGDTYMKSIFLFPVCRSASKERREQSGAGEQIPLIPPSVPFPSTPNGSTHLEKSSAHECGSDPSGDARSRSDTRSHPVPTSSIISDPEVTSSSPWAVPPNKIDPFGSRSMMEYPMVSIKGGRVKDLPGAKFHRIRGVKDSLGTPGRRRGRSKHGAKRPKSIRMKDVFSPEFDLFGPFFSTQSEGGGGKVIRVLPLGIVPDRPPLSTLLRYRSRRTENEKHLHDRELAEKDGQKQSHNINSSAGEGGGPLSSKPRGRRAGTYNCSEILSYIGRLDGGQKQLINKLVNFRTINGERTRARAIAHQTFHRSAQTERDVTKILVNVVENTKPKCEVEKVRVASTTHNVPEIAARDHKCSSAKIPDAYRKRGLARKKRDDPHEPTPTNRSFVHLRWWGPSLNSNLGGSCPGARSNFGNRVIPGNGGLAIKLDEVKCIWWANNILVLHGANNILVLPNVNNKDEYIPERYPCAEKQENWGSMRTKPIPFCPIPETHRSVSLTVLLTDGCIAHSIRLGESHYGTEGIMVQRLVQLGKAVCGWEVIGTRNTDTNASVIA